MGVGAERRAPVLGVALSAVLPGGLVHGDDGLNRVGEHGNGASRPARIAARARDPPVLQGDAPRLPERYNVRAAEAEFALPSVDGETLHPELPRRAGGGANEEVEAVAVTVAADLAVGPDGSDERRVEGVFGHGSFTGFVTTLRARIPGTCRCVQIATC